MNKKTNKKKLETATFIESVCTLNLALIKIGKYSGWQKLPATVRYRCAVEITRFSKLIAQLYRAYLTHRIRCSEICCPKNTIL